MNFANILREEARHTYTENGAKAVNSTTNACLDLFGSIGGLRNRDTVEVERIFSQAYNEDPLLATKILFYGRDVREGCGERKIFRNLIRYLATYHPEAIRPNIDLIGVYGRYDDLYSLIDTPVENDMWRVMKTQFVEDYINAQNGLACSLLAKWIKTPDASSPKTRELGIKTALKLGYSVRSFKRMLRMIRKHIGVVECLMSSNRWDEIKYPEVPSRAMMIYRNAFIKHDQERFSEFTNKAINGEEKINSSTLYPYDIVKSILNFGWGHCLEVNEDPILEAQWRQLPDYVGNDYNALVVSDLSGSMTCYDGLPMSSSIALAIYFAERNRGAFKDIFIPFSTDAHIATIKGETLAQKVSSVFESGEDYWGSTNLKAAFDKVLNIAIKNNISNEDMVKSLIVISDMEIDCAIDIDDQWSFYDAMKDNYARYGYDIPNIVFWNVCSRHDIFHADSDRKGVQLCSGHSASTFKCLMESVGLTPEEMMLKIINSERYSQITVG